LFSKSQQNLQSISKVYRCLTISSPSERKTKHASPKDLFLFAQKRACLLFNDDVREATTLIAVSHLNMGKNKLHTGWSR